MATELVHSSVPESTTDLWLSFPSEIKDESLLEAYGKLLSAEELQREAQFVFAKDRFLFRIARAALRTALSKYTATPPQGHTFISEVNGKPKLLRTSDLLAAPHFNLSHTQGLVVVAVNRKVQIGVDVEHLKARLAPLEVAERFFAPQEAEELAALPPSQQSRRFYDLWTLKEAFVKATGHGLSTPLDKISFQLGALPFRAVLNAALPEAQESWTFWRFQPSTHHTAALCVPEAGTSAGTINIWRSIPLLEARAFTCAVSRFSTD